MFLADKRRLNFMKIIDRWSESKLFKIVLAVCFSIGFIILVPIIIVTSPFILAWDLAGAISQSLNKKKYESPNKMDWDKIQFNISSWKNKENN